LCNLWDHGICFCLVMVLTLPPVAWFLSVKPFGVFFFLIFFSSLGVGLHFLCPQVFFFFHQPPPANIMHGWTPPTQTTRRAASSPRFFFSVAIFFFFSGTFCPVFGPGPLFKSVSRTHFCSSREDTRPLKPFSFIPSVPV